MKVAFGVLNIAPDTFWKMTMREFVTAFEGYVMRFGKSQDFTPCLKEDLKRLMERFPDANTR